MNGPVADAPIYIGIDAGTSGIRICAIDATATILAEKHRPLPAAIHHHKSIQQDPAIWASVMFALLADLQPHFDLQQIKAIAIDGTSGTVLLTDSDGIPISPALMYNDASSTPEVKRLQALCPELTVTHSVAAGLPKILHLAAQHVSGHIGHVMHQADWLAFQFSRAAGHSDANNCLKTGYDAQHRRWPECLRQLAPLENWLPRVHQTGQDMASISPNIASQHGLAEHTLIRAGTTDSTAAIVATGAHAIGDAITSLGSTLVMKVVSDTPIVDSASGIYSQPYGRSWLVGGGSNSGGAVLRQFFTDQQMLTMSEQLDPQKDTGLNYYPLPHVGERFPHNAPAMPPRLAPRPADDVIFFQGLLEGMAQIEYNAYRRLAELGAPTPRRVFSVGGGAVNDKWREIRQRYLQTEVVSCLHASAAFGSALIARQQDIENKGV